MAFPREQTRLQQSIDQKNFAPNPFFNHCRMPSKKHSKIRVRGVKKDYKYEGWLNSALQGPNPKLDYFTFADTFQNTKHATNSHYLDLLTLLSINQSNRLTKIAQEAQNLFDVST